jgi:hypothetical protein
VLWCFDRVGIGRFGVRAWDELSRYANTETAGITNEADCEAAGSFR